MKQSKKQARDRLSNDVDDAVDLAIAQVLRSWHDKDTSFNLAKSVGYAKVEIRQCVLRQLARNWRVSERARPQRSTGGDA